MNWRVFVCSPRAKGRTIWVMSDSETAEHPRHRRRGHRRRHRRFWLAIVIGLMAGALLAGTLWLINRATPSSRAADPAISGEFPTNWNAALLSFTGGERTHARCKPSAKFYVGQTSGLTVQLALQACFGARLKSGRSDFLDVLFPLAADAPATGEVRSTRSCLQSKPEPSDQRSDPHEPFCVRRPGLTRKDNELSRWRGHEFLSAPEPPTLTLLPRPGPGDCRRIRMV